MAAVNTSAKWPPVAPQPGCHAIERAWERYGVRLTFDDLQALNEECESGSAQLFGYDGKGCQLLIVEHDGVAMLAVYGRHDGHIQTFLPAEAMRP